VGNGLVLVIDHLWNPGIAEPLVVEVIRHLTILTLEEPFARGENSQITSSQGLRSVQKKPRDLRRSRGFLPPEPPPFRGLPSRK
jgi:hypothetical protein